MSFSNVSFTLPNELKNAQSISAAKSNLSSTQAAESVFIPNIAVDSASSDASNKQTELALLSKEIELLTVSPWHDGTRVNNKQSMQQTLTAKEAMVRLSEKTNSVNWSSCIVLLVSASDEAELSEQIENVEQGLGLLLRSSKAIANSRSQHEQSKTTVLNEHQHQTAKINLPNVCAMSLTFPRQAYAVASAIASDIDPVQMLDEFKQKRTNLHAGIESGLGKLSGSNVAKGAWVNGDVSKRISELSPPNSQDKFSFVWAFGGSSDALSGLQDRLSL